MRMPMPMPAQLISTREAPCAARALATASSPLFASATSHLMAMPPISAAIFLAFSSLMSSTATFAPALASARAVAAPRPEPPPVTSAD
jgi:hypothetical protein